MIWLYLSRRVPRPDRKWQWWRPFYHMMTSSNGNIFRVTDPLCREFTGDRWIPLTKASSSIGYFFRSPLRWRWKMAALPLPVAILDDLISGSCKWGHPRWRPEAEGPPFSTSTSLGIEKSTPSPGWCHFRRRHLESKMATAAMTSGGRRDAREDVLQTSAPSMSPVEVWLYWKHLIVSLTQALSKWLSELPACHYAEVDQSAHVESCEKPSTSASTYSTFFLFFFFFNCTLQ